MKKKYVVVDPEPHLFDWDEIGDSVCIQNDIKEFRFYDEKYFISLKEYRRRKLDNLHNKQNK